MNWLRACASFEGRKKTCFLKIPCWIQKIWPRGLNIAALLFLLSFIEMNQVLEPSLLSLFYQYSISKAAGVQLVSSLEVAVMCGTVFGC